MTKLSVNINKIALIRNSRGANLPNLIHIARDLEKFGAQGITIHPRPDQRHIRYDDIPSLKEVVSTELNIEGYPSEEFMEIVLKNKPHQCTLVPDPPSALTSDSGWDTITHKDFLTDIVNELKLKGIRVSLFVDPVNSFVEGAKAVGADRIEFYTGKYAKQFLSNPEAAIKHHVESARVADAMGLGINAGHDLDLNNLNFYKTKITNLLEVSIGHALVCDALYYGLHNTIQMYLRKLEITE
ncbi:MAG: pyridoxine 5'-phosphate synthase [Saprospiraceae bacterium]|nr:pyridoxine 5'-phosphate synthase [Saprospiraceae bacterium]